jgi:Proteasome subunit
VPSRYYQRATRTLVVPRIRWEDQKPTPAELGLNVTICIAAVTRNGMGGDIVAVSDKMISATDDSVQATETLKSRQISKAWAMMFAGEGHLFLPIVRMVKDRLDQGGEEDHDLHTVCDAVTAVYAGLFDAEYTARYLVRYNIPSITAFRTSGLAQFGKEKFERICAGIDEFDLGIQLLVYGYDKKGSPHIFEVANPGFLTDHDLLGYAVIGTGAYMATASLRRKKMPYDRASVVYRLLEAKFSAETASGVGASTTCFTMIRRGNAIKTKSIGYGSVDKLKGIWKSILAQPEPQEALDIISTLVGKDD